MHTLLAISLVSLAVVECSNILGIFHFPSQSHHILGLALLKGLAKDGHNVTLLSPFPVQEKIENFNHLHLEQSYQYKEKINMINVNMSRFIGWSALNEFSKFSQLALESKRMEVLKSPDTKFDVIIIMYIGCEALLGFSHIYDAPVIAFEPVGGVVVVNNILGNPAPFSYVPSSFTTFNDEMNFMQRTINTLVNLAIIVVHKLILLPQQKEILKTFFPGAPTIEVLEENIDLILVNSHIATETPRPYVPNVIQVGGFHIQETEALPEDLKQFLDGAEEGVVYFSLGSNVKSSDLPTATIDAFLSKFKTLPMKVLWKYETDLPNKPNNVKISRWLPQRAILGHRNVKAFIQHGGMGGTTEGLYFGVPMVCIPFYGDQQKNCKDIVDYGVAIQLDVKTLTEDIFSNALNEILNNPKYVKSAKFRSELIRNQAMNPMDSAIFWVNHVIRHKGAKHLKNKSTTLMWYQYFLIDVIAFLASVVLTILISVYFLTKLLFKKLFRKKYKKVKSN